MEEKIDFEYEFNKNYQKALAYTYKKIGDFHAAEDLVMNSFYICYKKINEFDSKKASFATWLYVILNNKIKNYYRDHKEYSDYEEQEIIVFGFEDELIETYYLANMRNKIADAIMELNEMQRKIVIFRYFGNKNATEIANELNISSGNVRIQLMRALEKLKKCLNNEE